MSHFWIRRIGIQYRNPFTDLVEELVQKGYFPLDTVQGVRYVIC